MRKAQQSTLNISIEEAQQNVLKEMNKLDQTPQLIAKKGVFEKAMKEGTSSGRAQSLLNSYEQSQDARYKSLIDSLKTLVRLYPDTVTNRNMTLFQNSNNLSNNNNQNSSSPLSTLLSTYDFLSNSEDQSKFYGQQNILSLTPCFLQSSKEEQEKLKEITNKQKDDGSLKNLERNQIYQIIDNQNLLLQNQIIQLEKIMEMMGIHKESSDFTSRLNFQ